MPVPDTIRRQPRRLLLLPRSLPGESEELNWVLFFTRGPKAGVESVTVAPARIWDNNAGEPGRTQDATPAFHHQSPIIKTRIKIRHSSCAKAQQGPTHPPDLGRRAFDPSRFDDLKANSARRLHGRPRETLLLNNTMAERGGGRVQRLLKKMPGIPAERTAGGRDAAKQRVRVYFYLCLFSLTK